MATERDRQQKPAIKRTVQDTQNWSFDEIYKVLVSGMLAMNSDGTALEYLEKDASGNLKTTATLSGGGGDGALLDGVSSSIKASVLDYTNSNPLAVRLTNTDGDYVSSDTSDLLVEMRIMNGAMAMQVDDTTGTIYQGWAEPGTATSAASWRIRKIVTSGSPDDTAITFADGDRSFNNIWDNRASLSYS